LGITGGGMCRFYRPESYPSHIEAARIVRTVLKNPASSVEGGMIAFKEISTMLPEINSRG
jgi:hypothetical protein